MKGKRTMFFINYYKCSKCGERWEDQWDCACNDRCPACRTETEPYESVDITPTDEQSLKQLGIDLIRAIKYRAIKDGEVSAYNELLSGFKSGGSGTEEESCLATDMMISLAGLAVPD
jgi:hypothetical protein